MFTLITLFITSVVHCCHVLSPLVNMIVNMVLLLVWVVGLGLLGWNMAGTLGHICSSANWGSADGIMVCRSYKALFAFTVLATAATVGMVFLDIKVRRKQTSLGRYNQMRDSAMDLKPLVKGPYGSGAAVSEHDDRPAWMGADHDPIGHHSRDPSRDTFQQGHESGVYHSRDASRDAFQHEELPPPAWLREDNGRRDQAHREDPLQPWETVRREPSDYQALDPAREPIRSSDFGYVSPPEQTRYDSGVYNHPSNQH